MYKFSTKFGQINGISSSELYSNGVIKECRINEYSELVTTYGNFVPQYDDTEIRRKYKKSIAFYENGNIKSISFQEKTYIATSMGKIPAELALFYEDGSLKRIFPLDGKLTAYWTEEDEYKLAEEMDLRFKFGNYKIKIINISFYESGEVMSLTLWPKDFLKLPSLYGFLEIRIGISLYPNGEIESCEPRRQTLINTSIGQLHAYDLEALGINGDKNSLLFNEDGKVKALRTSTDKITIKNVNGEIITEEPTLRTNIFNNTIIDVLPLNIELSLDKIKINENEYIINENSFYIDKFIKNLK